MLRRLSQLQNMAMADLVNDTYLKVRQIVGKHLCTVQNIYSVHSKSEGENRR